MLYTSSWSIRRRPLMGAPPIFHPQPRLLMKLDSHNLHRPCTTHSHRRLVPGACIDISSFIITRQISSFVLTSLATPALSVTHETVPLLLGSCWSVPPRSKQQLGNLAWIWARVYQRCIGYGWGWFFASLLPASSTDCCCFYRFGWDGRKIIQLDPRIRDTLETTIPKFPNSSASELCEVIAEFSHIIELSIRKM